MSQQTALAHLDLHRRFLLQAQSVVDTTDVDAARDTLFRTFLPHRFEPADRAVFRLRHSKFELNSISFNDIYYAAESHVTAPKLDEFYCVQLSLCGTCWIEQAGTRCRLPPGSIYVIDSQHPLKQIHPAGYRQIILRVNRILIEDFIRETLPQRMHTMVRFQSQPRSGSGAGRPLFDFIRYVCEESLREDSSMQNCLTAQCLERSLLATLLTCMPNNHQAELRAGVASTPASIARAQRFIDEHLSEPISVRDITSATRVSARSLYYAFSNHLGITPMEALKQRRLDLARELLQGGRQNGLRVSDVVYRCGFNHPSKFARDYRRRFGELPRETLSKGS